MSNPELELSADPVSTPLQEVLALFSTELNEVCFPDVDAGTLQELAESVRARAADVARARAVLEETRAALIEAQGELEQRAQRAVGYAKVFALGNGELENKLAALQLGRGRGRKGTKPTKAKANAPAAAPGADAEPKPRKKKRNAPAALPLSIRSRGRS